MRIKMFLDIQGTVDELGNCITETEIFFDNLKNLEEASGCIADITFVTVFDFYDAEKHFDKLLDIFKKGGMDGRITSCRYMNGYFNSFDQQIHTMHWTEEKYVMIRSMLDKGIEANSDDINLVLYAGDRPVDLDMILSHSRGWNYELRPCFFINCNTGNIKMPKSVNFLFYQNDDQLNYLALSAGFKKITELYLDNTFTPAKSSTVGD